MPLAPALSSSKGERENCRPFRKGKFMGMGKAENVIAR